jgi:hypothetical protein
MGRETEDVVAARDDAEVVVEGGGKGGREDEDGGTSEDDELVSDDVVSGTAELATGRLTLEFTSSPRKSLLGPPQTPLNPLETLSN